VVIVLAIMTSMMGLASAKMSQASLSSTSTNQIATKANSIANSDAELVRATAYNDLSSQTRQTVPDTGFQHEVTLGNESDYSKGIKQRTVTILVYKGNESTPRVSLPVTRYSVEKQETSGVPIGTVIAWPGSKAPTTNGIWLECNGQSCTAYPELVAVLGKNTVPDYRDRFLESSETVGTIKEAGLPNIEGEFFAGAPSAYYVTGSNTTRPNMSDYDNSATGAFHVSVSPRPHVLNDGANSTCPAGWESKHGESVYFNAFYFNSIYGNSTTVQPASVTVRRFIKAA
jgi:Tfp pilus assembly protein FimT